MKVFWMNGGLQLQPESDVEMEAMLVLLDGLKYERPSTANGPRIQSNDERLGQVERGLDLSL